MTIEKYIKQLMENPEYKIERFVIDPKQVFILVSEITPAQEEIPKTLYGKDVFVMRML